MPRGPQRYSRVHLVVHEPGDRSVGVQERWIEVSLKVEDPDFFCHVEREDFERSLRDWAAQWFDLGPTGRVFTKAELAAVERYSLDIEAAEDEYFRKLEQQQKEEA